MIEKKMYRALYEILIFAIFMFFVGVVSSQNKDLNSYGYNTAVKRHLTSESMGGIQFDSINRIEDAWTWMQYAFAKALDCKQWYNGNDTVNMTRHVFDYSSILIGNVSVRQKRTKPNNCSSHGMKITGRTVCTPEYSVMKEDKGDYDLGWNLTNTTGSEYRQNVSEDVLGAFKYKKAKVSYKLQYGYYYKLNLIFLRDI